MTRFHTKSNFTMCLVFCLFVLIGNAASDFPFRNTSLSWDDRVDDLVGRLTLEEIMYQMTRGGVSPINGPTPPIERLGIGPYSWDTECLRGDVKAGNATSFPEPIGLAASFQPGLIYRVAEATSVEVRAKYTNYSQHGVYGTHRGISCLSPVINILRDPRWGRNPETYGEDPYLTGVYATNFVQGLQGNHPRYLRANSGCKHFDAYGGPENIPANRHSFNALVSERDWRTTFLPAFRTCVKAGTFNIMCSYNSINGLPSCANPRLLTDILRGEWGFTGYVISDQGAIQGVMVSHNFTNTSVDTVAACVNAGVNLEISAHNQQHPIFTYMYEAVQQGKMNESLIRERVKPLFYTRMRLGEFDPPDMNPYTKLNLSVIESRDHRELAVEAAMKSFVLLKNDNQFLPLKKKVKTIAAVGPMVFEGKATMGGYAPDTDPSYMSTTVMGLQPLGNQLKAVPGCNTTRCPQYNRTGVIAAVKGTDIVFVALGLGSDLEAENNDRADIELPPGQVSLLKDAVENSGKAPVVLLLFNAGAVNITWAVDHPRVLSIIEMFYPAQATGEALRRILTNEGQGAVPAGRLPYTWPRTLDGFPSMTDYSMEGRTYRYMKTKPMFPFGYGLSYSKFEYPELTYKTPVQAGENCTLMTSVINHGPYDADECIPASHTANVTLTIDAQSMAVWTQQQGWVIEDGMLEVYVGGQQPNQTVNVGSNVLLGYLWINGTKVLGHY